MSAEFQIQDLATPALLRLMKQCEKPRELLEVAGRRLENELHDHFLARDAEGNKQGWPRAHFWSKVVNRATSFQGATDTESTVSIASVEFLHKLRGGTITAKSGKMLAIPISPVAKAAGSPREWGDRSQLFVVKTASQVFLACKTGEGKGQSGIEYLYVLKHSVTQQADPRALPPASQLQNAILDAAEQYLTREGGAA